MARRRKSLKLFADLPQPHPPKQLALPAPKKKKPSKFPSRPRGRHSVDAPTTESNAPAIPVNQRLGFRPAEYAALTGVSLTHVWRGIKNGKIKTVDINGVQVIPRSHAIEQGIIKDGE
jgi:hypothetical protein